VSKTGFITQQYGQTRPFAAAQPLTVGERQSLQANFTLGRAGAISGRVLDEFGDPVAGARVQVLRSRYARGRRTLAPTGVGDQTGRAPAAAATARRSPHLWTQIPLM
jgi:hypothetical protein